MPSNNVPIRTSGPKTINTESGPRTIAERPSQRNPGYASTSGAGTKAPRPEPVPGS